MKILTWAALMLVLAYNISAQETGTFVDPRDNKEYKTVKIGNQVWLDENLAYKTKDDCWPYAGKKKLVKEYGYLYTWQMAKEACPAGWHLPSDEEWKELELFIGINEVQMRDLGNRKNKPAISFRLRPAEGWKKGLNGTNEMGFNMLPGGKSGYECCFESMGEHAYFWSSTLNSSDNTKVIFRVFYEDGDIAAYNWESIYSGLYVRCVKDR